MMVLYQKVYTYQVYLFFVPLVFIGAFFLLNLTLAVINTSFNAAQERIKEAKEKREKEMRELSVGINPAKNEMEDGAPDNQDQPMSFDGTKQKSIGLHEFYIAKKTAARLKAFAHRVQQ